MKPGNKIAYARAGILILATVFFWQLTVVRAQKVNEPAATSGSTSRAGQSSTHPFEPTEELIYTAEFSRALLKKA